MVCRGQCRPETESARSENGRVLSVDNIPGLDSQYESSKDVIKKNVLFVR